MLILFVARGKISTDKREAKKTSINSYITFKQPSVTKPQDKQIEVSNDESRELANKLKIVDAVKTVPVENANIKESAAIIAQKVVPEKPVAVLKKPNKNIQTGTFEYIQEANKTALDRLSSDSLSDYLKPKPINGNSRSRVSQKIQEELDKSFAPLGADITVVSKLGTETLILHGDSCYQVHETELDDKVYRGAAVWTRSGACGKTDKFNGQLQISLDKYLKK